MYDLDNHLLRLHGSEYVLANGLLLHVIAELLCNFVADIGIEQGSADVLHGLGNVYLGDFAFTLEYLERPFKSFA